MNIYILDFSFSLGSFHESNGHVQILLEATVGNTAMGDIAVDDVSFTQGPCPGTVWLVRGAATPGVASLMPVFAVCSGAAGGGSGGGWLYLWGGRLRLDQQRESRRSFLDQDAHSHAWCSAASSPLQYWQRSVVRSTNGIRGSLF